MEKENKPKRKILKYILLILLAAIIIFVALTVRKMIIITGLKNKISEYIGHTNYYAKAVSKDGTKESYTKDNSYIGYVDFTRDRKLY